MPTLDWIGKKAVLNHHREVPYHLLKCDKNLSPGDPDSGNLLVQGDNLIALKALLLYYAGKVKCIYIDPPYNTGVDERDEKGTRAGWVYSDNVNSPEIREWLGKVVGKEAEDLPRHDKWLCMAETATDRFYPDFVARLTDGRILTVEYKGEDRWSNDDSKEKRAVGELWAARSGGRCLFVMPKGKDWNAIRSILRR